MRLNRWVSVVAGLLALSLPLGSAHAQTDEDKAAARSLAKQGAEAFAAGKHAEALDLMSRAEAILHAPPHVLYIARAQAALGKLVAAREGYLKVIREDLPATAPKAFKDAQQQAKEEVAAIEPRIASLRILIEGGAGTKVTVKLDGQAMSQALVGVHRPVDPGKHVVIAYPIGLSPVEQNVELAEGEKKEVKLVISGTPVAGVGVPLSSTDDPDAGTGTPQLPPDKKTSGGLSTLAIVGIGGLGVGVAGVVVGALFMVKSGNKTTMADEKFTSSGCDMTPVAASCDQAAQSEILQFDNDAASAQTIGVVGLIAGGVFLAGGATALIIGLGKGKTAEKPKATWITPWISPGGAGVRGTF